MRVQSRHVDRNMNRKGTPESRRNQPADRPLMSGSTSVCPLLVRQACTCQLPVTGLHVLPRHVRPSRVSKPPAAETTPRGRINAWGKIVKREKVRLQQSPASASRAACRHAAAYVP